LFSHLKGVSFKSSFNLNLDSRNFTTSGDSLFECKVAGPWILDFHTWLEQMMNSRESNREMYFSRFPPSVDSLTSYLVNGPINNPNQVLFLIIDKSRKLHGHVGFKIDKSESVEIDNLLRTSNEFPGIIRFALGEILNYCTEEFGFLKYSLKVSSRNERAIKLYQEFGFEIQNVILLKTENLSNGITNLVPADNGISDCVEKMLIMERKY